MKKNSVAQRPCRDSTRRFDRLDGQTSKSVSRWFRACAAGASLVVACIVMLGLCAPMAHADDITYAYDESGRLIQASNFTTGEAVRYTYDVVGNITSQITGPLSTLAIGQFTPRRGPVGAQVTINGTGFAATPAGNVVRFNGVQAQVVSTSQAQLVVTVPASATSGPISVEVGGATATSTEPFTVTATSDGPFITVVLPNVSSVGNVVTIVGTGFSETPAQNRVRFGNATAEVSASTSTTITTRVPQGAGSGKIRVTTPLGVAVSPTDFIVLPGGFSADQIGSVDRVNSDGSANIVSFAAAARAGIRLFEGTAGELLSIGVTNMTYGSTPIVVYGPDNKPLVSGTLTTAVPGLQLPKLPATGTYTIVLTPNAVGSLAISVFKPIVTALSIDGPPAGVNVTPPGRRVLLTFDAPANTYANVVLSSVTLTAGEFSIIAPNGSVLKSQTFNTAGFTIRPWFQQAGKYTLLINPTGHIVGSALVQVQTSLPASLTTQDPVEGTFGASPVTLTFRGQPGQYLSILTELDAPSSFSLSLSVANPDGTPLASRSVGTWYGSSRSLGSGILNLGPLPMGGTYTVTLQRSHGTTSELTLTLSGAAGGPALIANGALTGVDVGKGQSVLRSFSARAGQFYSIAIDELPGFMRGGTAIVLKPDGSVLKEQTFEMPLTNGGILGGPSDAYRDGSTVVNMGPMPVSGTYHILVRQSDMGRPQDRYSGRWRFNLTQPDSRPLGSDGSDVANLEGLGRGVLYRFSGTVGEYLSFGMATGQGGVGQIGATVFDPDGIVVGAGTITYRPPSGGSLITSFASGVANIGPLRATGSYTIFVQQLGRGHEVNGELKSYLSRPVGGSLQANHEPTDIEIGRTGQGVLHTFSASAGDYRALSVTTNGSISGSVVHILRPDGVVHATTHVSTSPVGTSGWNYVGRSLTSVGPLPVAGTYAVLVQQTGSANGEVGTIRLQLSAPATGTLPSNGSNNTVNLPVPAQGLRYSFTAGAGEYRSLVLSESFGPIQQATVSIVDPQGTTLTTGTLSTSVSGSGDNATYSGRVLLNVGPLPVTGNYAVVMQQLSGAQRAGSVSLTLSEPLRRTLVGTDTVTVNTVGQGILGTFTGTAGDYVTAHVSETASNISGANLKIVNAAGTVLQEGTMAITGNGTSYSGTGSVTSGALPATGTYGVLVQQTSLGGSGTGALTLQLSSTTPAPPTTTNIATTTPGQRTSFTFAAVARQSMTVAMTNVVLTNPANHITLFIYYPDGSSPGGHNCFEVVQRGCVLPLRNLPQTGTYRIEVAPAATDTISATAIVSTAAAGALVANDPASINLTTVGQAALMSFTAAAGESFALNLSSLVTSPANVAMNVHVINPSHGLFTSGTTSNGVLTFNLSNLTAGRHQVWIVPQYAATSSMQVTLHPRLSGSVPTNGTVTNISTPAPGQVGHFNFTAEAGQSLTVALTEVVLTPSPTAQYYVAVYRSHDSVNVGGANCWSSWAGCEVAIRNLAQSGTYRIEITPPATQALSGKLTVAPAATGTLSLDVPMNVNLSTMGQAAHLSFTASGHPVSLNIGALSTTPANTTMYVTVFDSAGNQVLNGNGAVTAGLSLNLPSMPVGTYYVWLRPQYPATSTMEVTMKSTSSLPVNGTPTSFQTARPGQVAYFNFTADAGDALSVAVTQMTTTPSDAAQYYVSVYRIADGQSVAGANCWNTWPAGCEVAIRELAQGGTYRIEVVPSGLQTMNARITVAPAITGVISHDAPMNLALDAPGKTAHLRFITTGTQELALHLGALSTVPADQTMYVTVYNSAGAGVAGGNGSLTNGLSMNLGRLPPDTYFIWVRPQYAPTATVELALRTTPAVAVSGTPVEFATPRSGQVAYFNFTASAGDSPTVAFTEVTLTPSAVNATYYVNVYRTPDLLNVGNATCYTTLIGCEVAVRNLAQSGTYRVDITPAYNTQTIAGRLTISPAHTGTLVADTPFNANLSSIGQSAHLGFSATGTQELSINVGTLAMQPANQTMYVTVYNSAGAQVPSANGSFTTGMSMNLGRLAAGNYFVWVRPQYPVTSTLEVTLRATPIRPVDGTTVNFATPRPGQVAYFNFTASAGDSPTVAFTEVTLTPSAVNATYYVNVYRTPDLLNVGNATCYTTLIGCEVAVRNLAQSGTYRVDITPAYNTQTIAGRLTISPAHTGTLVADTPFNANLSSIGQSAHLGFSATGTQELSINVGALSMEPAGQTMYVTVYNSAGTQVPNANGSFTTGMSMNLGRLAAGNYFVWVRPQYPVTSTLEVTLRATSPVPVNGTAVSFATARAGQVAYHNFTAAAGDSLSVAFSEVVLTPSAVNTAYYVNVYRTSDLSNVGSATCYSSTIGCELPLRKLAQAGTYRVDITPAHNTQTVSGKLTLSSALTGTLTPGTPLAVNLTSLGQPAAIAFTLSASHPGTLQVASISTTPANVNVYATIYNATGHVTSSSSATSMTFNIASLPAGDYVLWIWPQYPVMSSMTVSY
jgi:large repetitive protein